MIPAGRPYVMRAKMMISSAVLVALYSGFACAAPPVSSSSSPIPPVVVDDATKNVFDFYVLRMGTSRGDLKKEAFLSTINMFGKRYFTHNNNLDTTVVDEMNKMYEASTRASRAQILLTFDLDNKRRVDKAEIAKSLAIRGIDKAKIDKMVEEYFKYDKNNDGVLTLDEMLEAPIVVQNPDKQVINAFLSLPAAKGGSLSFDAFRDAAMKTFDAFDLDKNGVVSLEEYKKGTSLPAPIAPQATQPPQAQPPATATSNGTPSAVPAQKAPSNTAAPLATPPVKKNK